MKNELITREDITSTSINFDGIISKKKEEWATEKLDDFSFPREISNELKKFIK